MIGVYEIVTANNCANLQIELLIQVNEHLPPVRVQIHGKTKRAVRENTGCIVAKRRRPADRILEGQPVVVLCEIPTVSDYIKTEFHFCFSLSMLADTDCLSG
jgi:hypothetical protein